MQNVFNFFLLIGGVCIFGCCSTVVSLTSAVVVTSFALQNDLYKLLWIQRMLSSESLYLKVSKLRKKLTWSSRKYSNF